MRIDKYLKVSRVLKRRTTAKELGDHDRIKINGRIAKASSEVNIGDVVEVTFGNRKLTIRVLDIKHQAKKGEDPLFEIIDEAQQ